MSAFDLEALGRAFGLRGNFLGGRSHGGGHINDTFAVTYEEAGQPVRYVLQRINRHVFHHPDQVMENIARVTAHLHSRGLDARHALTVIPATDGKPFFQDAAVNFWRAYLFIENTIAFDRVENPAQAAEAARAFGEFQALLAGLPGERLHETIVGYHHTRSRFEALVEAWDRDILGRAQFVRAELDFACHREAMVDVLLDQQERGILPERVTHNDTKLNNVLFDVPTGRAICVVDLDTVMPGLVLHDFGDLVRSATSPTLEDEKNLSKIHLQLPIFEALASGYIGAARSFLTDAEKAHLAFAGKILAFETGLRFLTDFLDGDRYFKIKRDGHNLDRCRSQFKLVESIEAQEDAMRRIVDRL